MLTKYSTKAKLVPNKNLKRVELRLRDQNRTRTQSTGTVNSKFHTRGFIVFTASLRMRGACPRSLSLVHESSLTTESERSVLLSPTVIEHKTLGNE